MIRELGEIQNKLCRAHWFLIAMCDGLHEIRLQIKPSGRKMDRQQIAQDMRERGERITLSSDKGLSYNYSDWRTDGHTPYRGCPASTVRR